MDRQAFDETVDREIEQALDRLPGGNWSKAEHILRRLAQNVEIQARNYYLLNLRTVDDLAEEFGISVQRMRAIAQNRHERFGVGMKIGKAWVWSPDEIDRLRPDEKYRAD